MSYFTFSILFPMNFVFSVWTYLTIRWTSVNHACQSYHLPQLNFLIHTNIGHSTWNGFIKRKDWSVWRKWYDGKTSCLFLFFFDIRCRHQLVGPLEIWMKCDMNNFLAIFNDEWLRYHQCNCPQTNITDVVAQFKQTIKSNGADSDVKETWAICCVA